MMVELLKKSIAKSPADDCIYLIKKLNEKSGFFVCNGSLQFLVKSDIGLDNKKIKTDFLQLNTNVPVVSVKNSQNFESGRYDVLMYCKDCFDESYSRFLESFVRLCLTYSKQISSMGFVDFFYSLMAIFQIPSEQSFRDAVGLFGELTVIKEFFDKHGKDISSCWHKDGSRSKYDFYFDKCNLEVKSTVADDCVLRIKHFQLFNNDENYLATVWLQKSPQGCTLQELVSSLKNNKNVGNGIDFAIRLEEELMKVDPYESNSVPFVVNGLNFYKVSDINPFASLPDNVDYLEYDLDLSSEKETKVADFIRK